MRLALSLGSLVLSGVATAGEIRVDYEFDFPRAGACTDGAVCQPWSEKLATLAQEGHPVVPVRLARVLVPAGERVVAVTLTGHEARPLAYTPRLAARQIPLTPGVVVDRVIPTYDGGEYPQAWLGAVKETTFRGRTLVDVAVHPLRVLGGGEAEIIERATLVVTTAKSLTYNDAARGLVRDDLEAEARADNKPLTEGRIVPPHEEVGYLIIGPRSLIGTPGDTPLQALIQDKEDRQLLVKMVALEDVAPSKEPKSIREAHKKDSIDYVLLVGDKANFPWKYVKSGVRGDGDPVPSDQYYACHDGGEWTSPSDIDWACEVAVGRVGAKTRADVANWVEKTVALSQRAEKEAAPKALHFGEKLDSRTLGERVLEFLIKGTDRAPRTVGFPERVSVTKLYETFRKEVSADEFISTVNGNQFLVVNHLGHANETYVFRTTANKLPEIKAAPAFYYSQGCYPNDPDHDNWTIRTVRMPKYGPAAMISNTRYGWYAPGSSDEGSSSVLHRTFWSQRFASGVRTVGVMNHEAKETVYGTDRSALMVYTLLESNLIGDPALDLGL